MVVPDKISVAAFRGERFQVMQWLNGGHVDALAANGDGLLHAAAAGGRLLVAKELLNRGATVDLRGSSNTTPLMFAVNHAEPLPKHLAVSPPLAPTLALALTLILA